MGPMFESMEADWTTQNQAEQRLQLAFIIVSKVPNCNQDMDFPISVDFIVLALGLGA